MDLREQNTYHYKELEVAESFYHQNATDLLGLLNEIVGSIDTVCNYLQQITVPEIEAWK